MSLVEEGFERNLRLSQIEAEVLKGLTQALEEEGGRMTGSSSTTPDRERTSLLGYLYLDDEGRPREFIAMHQTPQVAHYWVAERSWSKARSMASESGKQDTERPVCSASRAVQVFNHFKRASVEYLLMSCSTETQKKMLLDLLMSLDSGESEPGA